MQIVGINQLSLPYTVQRGNKIYQSYTTHADIFFDVQKALAIVNKQSVYGSPKHPQNLSAAIFMQPDWRTPTSVPKARIHVTWMGNTESPKCFLSHPCKNKIGYTTLDELLRKFYTNTLAGKLV